MIKPILTHGKYAKECTITLTDDTIFHCNTSREVTHQRTQEVDEVRFWDLEGDYYAIPSRLVKIIEIEWAEYQGERDAE